MGHDDSGATFEALRRGAKRWLKAIRSGDTGALARLERALPKHSEKVGLREVQQALARERGFASWARLKEDWEDTQLATRGEQELVRELLLKACLSYGNDDFSHKWRRAERLRARYPELGHASVHAAVVCGELAHVRKLLDDEPGLVNLKGGPQNWEPLLFLCYARLPNGHAAENSVAIAELLLDRGADANAAWFFEGDAKYRFTALTGAMGQGELNQPEHPQAEALVRLLLERGADANDSQGLYDTCLIGDETRWLELLFRHGLRDQPLNWSDAKGPVLGNLNFLVAQAAVNGQIQRLCWLLEHGADPNARSPYTGKGCHESALLAGFAEAARILVEHGARVEPLAAKEALVAAVNCGDAARARELAAAHPEYLRDAEPLVSACERGQVAAVRLWLELGLDPNGEGLHHKHALHVASTNRELAALLYERGADARARCYGGTVTGWALHAGDREAARYHAERSRTLSDAARSAHVELMRELLALNPELVGERTPSANTALHDLPADPDAARELIVLLLDHGADAAAKNDAGHTPAEHLERVQGLDDIADLLESEIADRLR